MPNRGRGTADSRALAGLRCLRRPASSPGETHVAHYSTLKARLQDKEIIRLDGAVGTQLQATGVPMNPYCWAAIANHTHPSTVRKMHEDYIRAGADVITTNTYSAARHNYEAAGLGQLVSELNLRAVVLAQEARDRVADRPVYIAGSVSNFGAWMESEYQRYSRSPRGTVSGGIIMRSLITEAQARRNLAEQVAILVDAGVDFLIAEATGNEVQREWVLEAVTASGLPYWAGFKCHVDDGEEAPRSGYMSERLLSDELDARLPLDADVVCIFHSTIEDTDAAIPVVRSRWQGALGAYPEAGRKDYTQAVADPNVENPHTLDEWVATAKRWTGNGVQVIGGCCGMGLDHIRALEGQLPERLAA